MGKKTRKVTLPLRLDPRDFNSDNRSFSGPGGPRPAHDQPSVTVIVVSHGGVPRPPLADLPSCKSETEHTPPLSRRRQKRTRNGERSIIENRHPEKKPPPPDLNLSIGDELQNPRRLTRWFPAAPHRPLKGAHAVLWTSTSATKLSMGSTHQDPPDSPCRKRNTSKTHRILTCSI
ncbi:hypothetical protein Bca101_056924 [Brassica carinata]